MKNLEIDCGGIKTEAEFWDRYLAAAKPQQSGFGRNLDAFWDAVQGDGPGSPGLTSLAFTNTNSLQALHNGHFLESLRAIARDTTRISVTLT